MVASAEPTTAWVEMVGMPSPFASRQYLEMKALGKLTPKRRAWLWDKEQKRQMRGFAKVPGHTIYNVTPQRAAGALAKLGITGRPPLTRTFVWGPRVYIQEMPLEDIKTLMLMDPMHEQVFRVRDTILV